MFSSSFNSQVICEENGTIYFGRFLKRSLENVFFFRTDRTWLARQRVLVNKITAGEDDRLHERRDFVDVPEPKVPSFPDDCSMCSNIIIRFHDRMSKSRVGNARQNYASNSSYSLY